MSDDFERLAAEEAAKTSALDTVLQPLASTVSFMQTGAHPDDETSGLLALLARAHGLRLSYACATRGEGGQNALGPERGDDLAMIRVREMELAAESLRCRLYWLSEDLGDPIRDWRFSKSGEETLDVWGRERTLERMVRILREEQPDIVCPTFLDVGGQHGHHRAMTRIAREAFDIAGDASAYPQHLADGLPPWRAAKFYLPAWSGAGDSYDDSEPPPPATLDFDIGTIDPATGVPYVRIGEWSRRFHHTQGMGRWIEVAPMPRPLHLAVSRVGSGAETLITSGIPATLAEWADAEPAIADHLRRAHDCVSLALESRAVPERLGRALALARERIDDTIATCTGKSFAPALPRVLQHKRRQLDDALAVLGGRPAPPVVTRLAQRLPLGPAIAASSTDMVVNRSQPSRPHDCLLHIADGADIADDRFGIAAVDGLAACMAPRRTDAAGSDLRRMSLTVDAAVLTHRIETGLVLDGVPLRAVSRAWYRHTGHVSRTYPARIRVQTVDAHIAPGTRVGYFGGGFDSIDRWLRGIGIETEVFDAGIRADDTSLQRMDITRFSTLVVGIQAFGVRKDLLQALPQLHAFVRAGGHLVTFYHRPADGWRGVPLAPITIGLPSVRWRTTRADATVTHLVPGHPLLNAPNVIAAADWTGWVKERGLYFARYWDPAYTPLLAMSDPDEAPHAGALLTGVFGQGRHTHCALALHTQLDGLVPGAFRLLANLVQGAR